MPRAIYGLMELYPQGSRRRPSVEYVPLPYRAPAPPLPHDGDRK
jgi:Serine dehydrogenase proteinase